MHLDQSFPLEMLDSMAISPIPLAVAAEVGVELASLVAAAAETTVVAVQTVVVAVTVAVAVSVAV